MENLQRTGTLGGQCRGGNKGRQPQGIPVPVQHLNHQSMLQELREQLNELIIRMERLKEQKTLREKLKEQQEKLSEQQILIDTLSAEKQGRQIKEQLESCRMMECNLEKLRRLSDVNNSRSSHDGLRHKKSTQKRKAPWIRNQGKGKKVAQTKQQNRSQMPGLQQCPKCEKYHPGINCMGKRVCYQCLELGHTIKDCLEHRNHHQGANKNEQQYNSGGMGPQSCPRCKGYHQGTDCDGKRICYECQKPGHISWNCPLKAAKKRLQNLIQKSVQTGQQKQKLHPCWKCGNYHPGVACNTRPICSKCREPGHIGKDCSQMITEFESQNIDLILASLGAEVGESSEMVPNAIV